MVRVLRRMRSHHDHLRRGRAASLAAAPVIALPDLAGVTIVHQAGAGRAVTYRGSYPLGGMDLTHAPSGRGVLTFRAGAGALQLTGDQADEVAPGRWRLRIDHYALISTGPARGDCDLVSRASPPTYVSLSCRVTLAGDASPTVVKWKGDGSPSVRVR